MRRLALLLLLFCCLAVLPGCGSGDIDEAIQHARDKARKIRTQAQQEGEKHARQVGEALDRVQQAVPHAHDRSQAPSAAGQRRANTIDGFRTEVREYGNPQHHGTPAQRRAAWLLGYRSPDPSRCANPGV